MQNLARTPDRIDALVAAFAAAEYVVDAECDAIVIRVGAATPSLDRLLGDRAWAVITAHNPDGRLHAPEANAAAQRALEDSLRESQPQALLKVCNRDPRGLWPDEPAWLFTPRSIFEADRLAQRFGQRAIVAGLPGCAAQLRIYGDASDASGATATVVS